MTENARYFLNFFGTNGSEGSCYPASTTLDVSSIGFRDLKGGAESAPPSAVRWVKIAGSFMVNLDAFTRNFPHVSKPFQWI